jgi:hypothetical protein
MARKALWLLIAPAFAIGIACDQSPENSNSGWNNAGSGWESSAEYSSDSAEAQRMFAWYSAHSGARWGWWFDYEICCTTGCSAYTATLFAGQTINAGTVTVTNDATNLYVDIAGANGWILNAAHVYAGACPIPTNTGGNPAPGLFPWQQTPTSPVATISFTIPLSSLPASCADTIAMAVHTESVQVDTSGAVTSSETGWAFGPYDWDDDCDGGTTEPPDDGCPDWIDTLNLDVDIEYSGNSGYLTNGWPIYHIGDTVYADVTICNPTTDNVDNLTITIMEELYMSGVLLSCTASTQQWTGVQIAANDCITVSYSMYLDTDCPYGNYQTHVVITRAADDDCPESALIYDEDQVGIYDPPAEG